MPSPLTGDRDLPTARKQARLLSHVARGMGHPSWGVGLTGRPSPWTLMVLSASLNTSRGVELVNASALLLLLLLNLILVGRQDRLKRQEVERRLRGIIDQIQGEAEGQISLEERCPVMCQSAVLTGRMERVIGWRATYSDREVERFFPTSVLSTGTGPEEGEATMPIRNRVEQRAGAPDEQSILKEKSVLKERVLITLCSAIMY